MAKSFKQQFEDNPALQFISGAEEATEREEKAPEGYKPNPLYTEKKTRRLQLVLQPSLYKKVQEKAKSQKLSVNEYIHRILEEATEGE